MSAWELAAQVLLWAGVAAELICCVGVWWMRDVFDRLHYGAAAGVGAILIGISAAITGAGSLAASVEATAATVVLLLVNPLATHAMGRAARQLLHGDVQPDAEQLEEAP